MKLIHLNINIFLFVFFLFMLGCKEPYYPEIESQANIMVVDGLITTSEGPYTVSLFTSTDIYAESSKSYPIENAIVYINVEEGTSYYFKEVEPGIYQSDKDDFRGEIGASYILGITTAEGDKYISAMQAIPPLPTLETINSYKERKKIFKYNVYGDLYYVEKDYVVVSADLKMEGEEVGYYKSNWKSTLMLKGEYLIDMPPGTDDIQVRVYIGHTFYQYATEINVSTSLNMKDNLLLDDVVFSKSVEEEDYVNLVAQYDSLAKYNYNVSRYGEDSALLMPFEGDSIQLAALEGWLVNIEYYSLNEEGYTFWKNVKDQLEYTGEVFDPIQTQIVSNVKCITDSTKQVLGFFEASSMIELSVLVNFKDINGAFNNYILDSVYNFPKSFCTLTEIPYFWNYLE